MNDETRAYNQDALRTIGMMTPEQAAMIDQPKAWENTRRVMGFPLGAHGFQMTGHFATVMQVATPEMPVMPSVSDRILLAKLIAEEVFETLFKGLGVTLSVITDEGKVIQVGPGDLESEKVTWDIHHREGDRYNIVETADGLSDSKVVCNWAGVRLGIPLHFTDYEVYCSNLSKVDAAGNPIMNRCNDEDCIRSAAEAGVDHVCEEVEHLIDPTRPVGKILKPEGYAPANIPAAIMAYINKEI